jgi:hypothetical protein
MGAPSVVVALVIRQDQLQMPLAEDQHPVGDLGTRRVAMLLSAGLDPVWGYTPFTHRQAVCLEYHAGFRALRLPTRR